MPRYSTTILIVDDDADDRQLIKDTFVQISNEIHVEAMSNGEEALHYLGQSIEDCRQLPSLILLDINMPRLNGKETLLQIKANPLYRPIPVAMFTTSSSETDKAFCLSNGACRFFTKPLHYSEFQAIFYELLELVGIKSLSR